MNPGSSAGRHRPSFIPCPCAHDVCVGDREWDFRAHESANKQLAFELKSSVPLTPPTLGIVHQEENFQLLTMIPIPKGRIL